MSHHKETSVKRQSPLGRARNHGSAKEGTHHWIAQRLSAIALIILGPWFLWNLYAENISSYQNIVAWLQSPGDMTLMVLLLVAGLYHAYLGLQVVVEDYVHCNAVKLPLLIGFKLSFILIAVMATLSLVRIQNVSMTEIDLNNSSVALEAS